MRNNQLKVNVIRVMYSIRLHIILLPKLELSQRKCIVKKHFRFSCLNFCNQRNARKSVFLFFLINNYNRQTRRKLPAHCLFISYCESNEFPRQQGCTRDTSFCRHNRSLQQRVFQILPKFPNVDPQRRVLCCCQILPVHN